MSPYITGQQRYDVAVERHADTAGELNYILTQDILLYVKERGLSYQTINDIIGALEGAKAEFQRRVVAPYEDAKAATNGDLPWPSVE